MALEFHEWEGGRVVEVRASGKLTKRDYERFVPEMERLIREHGKIRILFHMHDFHGWKPDALWQDVKIAVRHFAHVERLAFIGEKTWEKLMAQFCRPFTTARIRYFDASEVDQASAWVQAA